MSEKILVVSDTHGDTRALEQILNEFRSQVTALVHCGDFEISCEELERLCGLPVYMARGNCDYFYDRDPESLFLWGKHTCLVTHGHYYDVAWGREELIARAEEMGADLVFYGHTHCPDYYEDENVIVMNPGSPVFPRQRNPQPTFLLVEQDEEGKIHPQFYCY